jgi:PIN domain nuclease of toxin-antitoxin system
VLPVALGRVLALQDLPTHHKNPFDRLLIAQANAEEAVLISHDPVFVHYRVKVLWWGGHVLRFSVSSATGTLSKRVAG